MSTFVLPDQTVLQPTLDWLEAAGQQRLEAFVVWTGVRSGDRVQLTRAIRPPQSAYSTPDGLLVTVDGGALDDLNRQSYRQGEVIAAQVHSHPVEAYHSQTDNHFPLVSLVGSLSVVVPHFAYLARQRTAEWAWYRLSGYGRWTPLDDHTKIVMEP